MLEVVALLTMEAPIGRDPDALRDEKQRAFRAMRPLSPADVVRGQFRGYRNEKGVAPDSRVETFAAVKLYIDTWRWAGVPFYIRAGKQMPVTATEVLVQLKRPPQAVFDTLPKVRRIIFAFVLAPMSLFRWARGPRSPEKRWSASEWSLSCGNRWPMR